jgi:Carboxypeptidase regulatory-like domain/TonB dependent receptor/TonB-dependent Receptor Plug Domain
MAAKETLISSIDIQRNRASRCCALFLCATLVALFLLAMPAISAAQTAGTGALSGTVTDQSGSSVAGATVKVTSEASGEVRTVTTTATGYFVVPLLLPGTYHVEVSQTGFRSVSVAHIKITVTETNALTLRLEVGQIAETVIVEAQVAQLQTETSSLGRVTSSEQVESLPLAMRNFTQIIALNPGVSAEVSNAGELGRGGGGNNQDPTVSAGNWASDNNFQMNGVGVNDIQQSGYFSAGVAIPNPDTIQEFKVQTGQYDASYGRNAGANVDVVTKGGTNQYHGAAWEYFRNDALNANTFFLNSVGAPRAELKQNQFGGDFGGPIKKDKLQFFTSYQGTRQRNGLDINCSSSMKEAPLTNDRSAAALGALIFPYEDINGPNPTGRTALGGTQVAQDGSNINPVALALLNTKLPNGNYLIPTPQTVNTSPSIPFDSQGTLVFSEACPFTEDQFMTNADYEMSSKSKLSGRFFFANSGITYTLPQTNLTGGGSPPGAPVNLTQDFRNFSLTHTYIFTPTLLNEAEIAYHRIFATFAQAIPGFTWSQVGATVIPQDNDIPAVAIDAGGTSGLSLGGNGQNVQIAENTYTFQDSVSWTHGKHNFRFGAGLQREQNNQVGFHYLAGDLFLTWADFLVGQSGAQNGTGVSNVYGSLDLLGLFDRAYRDWEVWSYAQDDFKVTKRLTLNLGLRYDRIGDFGDAQGRNAGFDPSLADTNPPAGGTLAGTTLPNNYVGTIPAGVKQLNNDFGLNGIGQNTWNPRLGLAYQVPYTHDRVVIRAGYGVYHSRSTGQPFLQLISAPPYGQIREFLPNTAFDEQQPLPLDNPAFPTFVPYSPSTINSITFFEPNYRPPLVQEYSFGTQTQITPTLVLEVGYSGARGLHLIEERSVNQASLASASDPINGQTTNTFANIQSRVPFTGFSSSLMEQIESGGASWYNALLVSLNKRFSHGLQAQVSYTWAKDESTAVGTTTGPNGGTVVGNQNDLASGYGPDNFVRPQRLVINYSYQLPKLPTNNAFAQAAFGGWSVQGVTVFQTGHYLTVTGTNAQNVYGITTDRASVSGTCTPGQYVTAGSTTSKLTNYINKSCFTSPAVIGGEEPPGTCDPTTVLPDGNCPAVATGFGNAGVGILRGPSELNFDFSLFKNFPIHKIRDSANLQFRAEFFNIFNHPLFQDPDTSFTDAAFGQITNTYGNPRIVQLALKLSF